MNILAIDYGTKNIGLAWCDTGIGVVLPYGQVKGERGKVKGLAELIKKEKIDKVVIGLPMGLDGTENENTKRIRAFAEELKNEIAAPVEFANEMFSSQEADRMGGGGTTSTKLGASRDEKSAMVILESYVENVKCKNQKSK